MSLPAGPDTDADGLPDAWEYATAGNLTKLTATGDADRDGASDAAEYLAATNPLLPADLLQMVDQQFLFSANRPLLTWTSQPARCYRVFSSTDLQNWTPNADNTLPAAGPSTPSPSPCPPARDVAAAWMSSARWPREPRSTITTHNRN